MEQKEIVKKYFDDLSSDYQEAYKIDRDDPIRTFIFNRRKRIVLKLIDGLSGSLLDIGCGPGVMTREFLDKGFRVSSTDISPEMIIKAKESLKNHPKSNNLSFAVCEVENLKYEEFSFDVIICIGVIEYLDDYHIALKKISKYLKKGGVAIISAPNKLSILNFIDTVLLNIATRFALHIFSKNKSIHRYKVASRKFAPTGLISESNKYGLRSNSITYHSYRIAFLRRVFPQLSILLNNFLDKYNVPFLAKYFANDFVLKLIKDNNV